MQDFSIGGSYFDEIIFSLAKSQFQNQTDLTDRNIPKIKSLCEEAKIQLSSHDSSIITFEKGDETFTATISQTDFLNSIRDTVDDSSVFQELESRVSNENNDFKAVMIGGCAFSPFLRHLIGERLQLNITESHNPNEFVVKGTCLAAASIFLSNELQQWKNTSLSQNDQHRYKAFDFLLNFEISKTGNCDSDPITGLHKVKSLNPSIHPKSSSSPKSICLPNPSSSPNSTSSPNPSSSPNSTSSPNPSSSSKTKFSCCLLL